MKVSLIFLIYSFPVLLANEQFLNTKKLAVFKFKTYHPLTGKDIENKNQSYFDYLFKNHLSNIYLEMEIGEDKSSKNSKNLSLNSFLLMNEKYFSYNFSNFIEYNKENNNILCNYSPFSSKTFEEQYSIFQENNLSKIIKGPLRESIKVYSDLQLTQYENLKFNIHNELKIGNSTKLCGNIGMCLSFMNNHPSYGFLQQLNRNMKIDYIWSLRFFPKRPDEGLLILGSRPHEYLIKEYKKDNYFSIFVKPNMETLEWKFPIDSLIINNAVYEINGEEIEITSEVEGIEIGLKFRSYLDEIFFNNYYKNNICKNVFYKGHYGIIYCNATKFGKNEIKKFPKMIFYKFKINQNFTFNGEELFYYENGQYFFKIITNSKNKNNFKFGRIFLKKYQTVFEPEDKFISFYITSKKEYDYMYKNIYAYGHLLIIVVLLIFLCGFLFGRKVYRARKKLAYELKDENYVYNESHQNHVTLIEMK